MILHLIAGKWFLCGLAQRCVQFSLLLELLLGTRWRNVLGDGLLSFLGGWKMTDAVKTLLYVIQLIELLICLSVSHANDILLHSNILQVAHWYMYKLFAGYFPPCITPVISIVVGFIHQIIFKYAALESNGMWISFPFTALHSVLSDELINFLSIHHPSALLACYWSQLMALLHFDLETQHVYIKIIAMISVNTIL